MLKECTITLFLPELPAGSRQQAREIVARIAADALRRVARITSDLYLAQALHELADAIGLWTRQGLS